MAVAGWAVDVQILIDPSATTTGVVTGARLAASSTFANLSPLSSPVWELAPGTLTRTTVVNDQGTFPAFPFDVTIGGTTTRPTGTKAILFDLSTIAGDGTYESMLLKFFDYPNEHFYNVLRAGFIKVAIGAAPVGNLNFDISQTYGPFSVPQLGLRSNGSHTWYGHSDAGVSAGFAATTGVFFYQWFRDMANNLYKIRFYDPSNGYALVGESQIALGTLYSYADYWLNGYNGTQPAGNVQIWFGPTVYLLNEPTDFIPIGATASFSGSGATGFSGAGSTTFGTNRIGLLAPLSSPDRLPVTVQRSRSVRRSRRRVSSLL